MTERLYYTDAYLSRFSAVVTDCRKADGGYLITLSKTAFFPEGGGQPADRGKINGVAVLDVQENGGEIFHLCEDACETGSEVDCELDFEARFLNMQLHSGEHIISGFIHSLTGLDNVGFHIGSRNVTIDFNGSVTREQLSLAEELANKTVWSNIPIEVLYPAEDELDSLNYRSKKEIDGQLRLVRIGNADLCACCGTHVGRTGEIGMIKAVSMINYKSGVRITLQIGSRALADYDEINRSAHAAASLLSAKPEELPEAVEKLLSQLDERRAEAAALRKKINALLCESVESGLFDYCAFIDGADASEVRALCDSLCEKVKIAAVFSADGEGCKYCIGSRCADVRPIGRVLNEQLAGRGGGRAEMVQGSLSAAPERIKTVWNSVVKGINALT